MIFGKQELQFMIQQNNYNKISKQMKDIPKKNLKIIIKITIKILVQRLYDQMFHII